MTRTKAWSGYSLPREPEAAHVLISLWIESQLIKVFIRARGIKPEATGQFNQLTEAIRESWTAFHCNTFHFWWKNSKVHKCEHSGDSTPAQCVSCPITVLLFRDKDKTEVCRETRNKLIYHPAKGKTAQTSQIYQDIMANVKANKPNILYSPIYFSEFCPSEPQQILCFPLPHSETHLVDNNLHCIPPIQGTQDTTP